MKTTALDRSVFFYDKFFNWIIEKGPQIIVAIIVLLVGIWLIKTFSRWMDKRAQRKNMDASLRPFFLSMIVLVLRVLLIFLVMQLLGIQLTIFAALIGAVGVAAGLALSGTLQNFASGVLILLLKPFEAGDNVVAQGQEGTVTSIQLFFTVVTTYDNRKVIIPNSKLSNEVIINVSAIGTRRLDIELKFNYGVDFEKIKTIVQHTIDESADILNNPDNRIGISVLEESGFKVMVNIWLNAHGFHDARLQFQQKLLDNLKSSGINLPGMDKA